MIVVLSPAKNLDESPVDLATTSQPRFLEKSETLNNKLKTLSTPKLKQLMGISQELALVNKQRYLDFEVDHNATNSKPAAFMFMGDVYRGLDVASFDQKELDFAQSHVRILSGLYGLLRPMDLIQPYRLEMGTKLPIRRKKNLYEFWGSSLTDQLNEDVSHSGSRLIVNLASDEYWKSIKENELSVPVLKVNFREWRNGEYKFLSFNAKRARGLMTNYIVKHGINNVEGIKGFDVEDYHFNEELSSSSSFIFTRE